MIREAQLNPDRDLTRTDLTFLRRIAENMSKMSASIDKVATAMRSSKVEQSVNKVADKLGTINTSLGRLAAAIKK